VEFIEFFKELVNPQSIIKYGGLFLLIFVIFAETGLLVGFFLPGDSLLFTAGLLCATGVLDAHIVNLLLLCSGAAIIGNITGYFIGKNLGTRLFKKEESLFFKPSYLIMTQKFYEKHGVRAIVWSRFLPIFRTFVPVLAGAIKFDYIKFTIYNIVGAILWVFSLILAGYILGTQVPGIENYLEYIIIGLIVVTTIPLLRTYLKEKKQKKNNPPTAN
jgi:membrane-associated protein